MFWSKEFWPPNSPDLNPLDYYVWSVVESDVIKTAIETTFADIALYYVHANASDQE